MNITNKPLAVAGLTSYRYAGNYGWIMIGAKNNIGALSEANRSLSYGNADLSKLQIWNGKEYVKAEGK